MLNGYVSVMMMMTAITQQRVNLNLEIFTFLLKITNNNDIVKFNPLRFESTVKNDDDFMITMIVLFGILI